MSKEISNYIREFLEYLEIEKGRSFNTIKNYEFYLNRFMGWLNEQAVLKVAEVSHENVRQYRLWLNRLVDKQGELLKKNTQNYHLIAVRAFLKYLSKRDIKALAPEKIELAKMPQREVDFLDGNDLSRLLEAPIQAGSSARKKNKQNGLDSKEKEKYSILQLRDKAIMEMLFSTGLRVSELAALNISSINLDKDEFTVRGKGSKLRIVFISQQSKYWVSEYLAKRHDVNPYLFISHDRASAKREEGDLRGLTTRSIQRIVSKYARVAGITKQITPHTLRHSYATDLLINGADIRSVQIMLGHSSITTTQVYTHITNSQLRNIHKKFHNKGQDV